MIDVQQYIVFKRKMVPLESLDAAVIAVILVLGIQSEAALGSTWIPVASLALVISMAVGTKFAHLGVGMLTGYRIWGYTDIIVNTILAVVVWFIPDLLIVGIVWYAARVLGQLSSPIFKEAEARYEREYLVTDDLRTESAAIRKYSSYMFTGYSAGGSVAALVLLTVLQLPIVTLAAIGFIIVGPILSGYRLWLAEHYLQQQ